MRKRCIQSDISILINKIRIHIISGPRLSDSIQRSSRIKNYFLLGLSILIFMVCSVDFSVFALKEHDVQSYSDESVTDVSTTEKTRSKKSGETNEVVIYKSATEYDYPPFSVTSDGRADGFSVELLQAVAQEEGIKITFKIDEWNIIRSELESGALDVLPLVGYSVERDKLMDFSVPYIVLRGNIFIRKGTDHIQSEDDLYGKSLIVMKGDNSEEYALKMNFTEHLITVPTYTEAFKLLSSGKYDAILAQGLVGEKIINDLNLNNIIPVYIYDNEGQTRIKLNLTGYEQKFCFGVKEGDHVLLAKLNEGLAVVSENGTYDRLYQKWFPFLINDAPSALEIIKYVAIILFPFILIILVSSNVMVNRTVKEKTLKLTETSAVLEFERNKYLSTLISIDDGVVVVDNTGTIEMMNPIALAMIKINGKEAIGLSYKNIIQITDATDENKRIDPIEIVLNTGKVFNLEKDILLLSIEDQSIFIEVKASPILDDKKKILGVVMVLRDISKIRNHIHQIEYLSFHDSLTGLYNRRFFEEKMKELDNPCYYPITIAMADLNGLKLVNDVFGHLAGDEMLTFAAQIIRNHCREEDIIARWGGDEFVMIFPGTTNEDVTEIVRRIQVACSEQNYQYGVLSIAFGIDTKIDTSHTLLDVFKNAESNMYKEKVSSSEGAHGESVRMMLNTLFESSPQDKEHCERVSSMATRLAENLSLSPGKIAEIRTIGLLHDIGKIALQRDLLDRKDCLSEIEMDEIRKHSMIGFRILNASNQFAPYAKGVLYHHERVDGKGYPEGLTSEEIPIEAKIISIVDAYDAMSEPRPYKASTMNIEEIITEISLHTGTQFDEAIAKVFVESILMEKI